MVDFTYKEKAFAYEYDIETLPELFTIAFISDRSLSLILFGDKQFDDITEFKLKRQMINFAKKDIVKEHLKYEDISDLQFNIYLINRKSDKDLKLLLSLLDNIVRCYPLPKDLPYAQSFVEKTFNEKTYFAEYRGWNSANYDLLLCIAILSAFNKTKASIKTLTPYKIRQISNALIKFRGYPKDLGAHLERETFGLVSENKFNSLTKLSIYMDGHIDWAAISKTETSGSETLTPPNLKKMMAKLNMDVIIDESVASDDLKEWTQADKDLLIEYNFNDVLGTKKCGNVFEKELRIRDAIRRKKPYTSARYVDFTTALKYKQPTRDCTSARLAGIIVQGKYKSKLQDYESVSYQFPVPDKKIKGKFVTVDLLEYIKETEKYIHEDLYTFFAHFRGKDTRSKADNYKVIHTQPITHQGQINIPYHRNGKPLDCYIRASTGGAHGGVWAGLSVYNPEKLKEWIKFSPIPPKDVVPTIDLPNVIHIDWSSFYPTMASKMKVFVNLRGEDNYTSEINDRIKLKEMLPEAKADWTKEHFRINEDQDGAKLTINSCTGAANTHNPYALLPLDNKILSMRLIGNMHIYVLAQRLAENGAFIIATNTDGLYITGLSLEQSDKIVKEYVADYGLGVEPEIVDRFINRDTSNRVEFKKGKINSIGGALRHGEKLTFSNRSLKDNVKYPLIAGNAALEYMKQEDWLTKPYDSNIMRNYIEEQIKAKAPMSAFYHVYSGTKARKLTINGKIAPKVSRLVFTKQGDKFSNMKKSFTNKSQNLEIFNQLLNKESIKLSDLDDFKDLDYLDSNQKNIPLSTNNLAFAKRNKQTDSYVLKEYIGNYINKLRELKENEGKLNVLEPNNLQTELLKQSIKELTKELKELYSEISIGGKLCINQNGVWEPIVYWKDGIITDYTSHTGKLVNLKIELDTFNYDEIDVDAYLRWSENILRNWKRTANIKEINMTKVDDTIGNVLDSSGLDSNQIISTMYKNILAELIPFQNQ